jgi:hypothetical protein
MNDLKNLGSEIDQIDDATRDPTVNRKSKVKNMAQKLKKVVSASHSQVSQLRYYFYKM